MIRSPHVRMFHVGTRVTVNGQQGIVVASNNPYYDIKLEPSSEIKKNIHFVFIDDGESYYGQESASKPVCLSDVEDTLSDAELASGLKAASMRGDSSHGGNGENLQVAPSPLVEYSLMVFHRKSFVRRKCISIMRSSVFNGFILFLILLNTVFMAGTNFEHFNRKTGDITAVGIRNKLVIYSEPIFVTLFALEATVKIIALGFVSVSKGSTQFII